MIDPAKEPSTEFYKRLLFFEMTDADIESMGGPVGFTNTYRAIRDQYATSSTGDIHQMIRKYLAKRGDSSA